MNQTQNQQKQETNQINFRSIIVERKATDRVRSEKLKKMMLSQTEDAISMALASEKNGGQS